MTLFRLDDLRNHVARWRAREGRPRTPTTDRSRRRRAVELFLRRTSRSPVERFAAAFTVATTVLCLVAITSSVWREPQGGVALYRALLVLAAVLAVLVGAWTRWHRSKGASLPHLVEE
jgi:hypothetical protein